MASIWKRTASGVLLLILVFGYVFSSRATPESAATAASSWFGSSDLTLTRLGLLPEGQLPPSSVNGNIDCNEVPLTIKPEIRAPLPLQGVLQNETSSNGCVIETAYGVIDTRLPYIQLAYEDRAGLVTPVSGSVGLLGVPNSPMILAFTGGGYLQFFDNLVSHLHTNVNPLTHELSYTLSGPADSVLVDGALHTLPVNYDSASFSADGRWLVINSPGHALLRVNLRTFEVLPFAQAFDYGSGLGPNPQTAITNDGRYVIAGSTSFHTFKLYDLSSCGAVSATISQPVICQARDIWEVMQQKLLGFTTLSTLRFLDDTTFSLYAGSRHHATDSMTIGKYNLSVAGHITAQLNYLALGDSFSSGEGAYHYIPGTDTSSNLCHLSTESYPLLIAHRLDKNQIHSVACSGARMKDVLGSGPEYQGQTADKKPLFARDLDSIAQAFTPGQIPQIEFVRRYTPESLTLTVSGDDIGFADIVTSCVANLLHPTCYDSYEDRLELYQLINDQVLPLRALLLQLQHDSAPGTRIYIAGYPQVALASGNCADNVHLNRQELEFASTLVDQLNDMVHAAADSAGVRYVDVSLALDGHRLCETKSSSVAVNGLTLGNNVPGFTHGPLGNESYHPNVLGHQLLEQAILADTQNLTLAMPNKKATKPTTATSNKGITSAPSSGRPIKKLIASHVAPTSAHRQQTLTLQYSGARTGIAPRTTYTVSLGGQELGTFTSDQSGSLDVSLTIPANTAAGLQLIEVVGIDDSGQQDDINQIVYIDDPGETSPKPCYIVAASGHDADQDGIDDACDGFIDELPVNNAVVQTGSPATNSSRSLLSTTLVTANNLSINTGQSAAAKEISMPQILAAHSSLPTDQQNAQAKIKTGMPSNLSLRNLQTTLSLAMLAFAGTLTLVLFIIKRHKDQRKRSR